MGILSNRFAVKAAAVLTTTTAVFAMSSAPAQAAAYTDLTNKAGEYASCVKAVGFSGTWVCTEANGAANNASKAAADLFPAKSLHNGKGDAFRHCYWNALMTIDFGSDRAEEVATNHENYADGPAKEKKMDLANNKTGRAVGNSKSYNTNSKAKNRCKALAKDGKLVTLK